MNRDRIDLLLDRVFARHDFGIVYEQEMRIRAAIAEALESELLSTRVLKLREAAEELGISLATLRRLIDSGHGPEVIQLSTRRRGIRRSTLLEWDAEKAQADG